eukprot:13127425-Alexandrium_andersonii.AAC.1
MQIACTTQSVDLLTVCMCGGATIARKHDMLHRMLCKLSGATPLATFMSKWSTKGSISRDVGALQGGGGGGPARAGRVGRCGGEGLLQEAWQSLSREGERKRSRKTMSRLGRN